jgi:glycosyltransferase involved in cell wall biosynthesis
MKASVLHVLSTMDPKAGGVCQAVRTMVKGLKYHGIRSHVVSLDDNAVGGDDDDLELIALGKGFTSWNYHANLQNWLKIHMESYESVIVHGLWQFQCYAMLKNMSAKSEVRVYVMPHGMLDPYFQRAKGRRLKALRNKLIWMMIEQKLVSKADGILFTCETEKVLAREAFKGYKPRQELVIGLGVEKDMEESAAMAEEFVSKFPEIKEFGYLLFISRIHPKKGLDILLKAYLQLKAKSAKALPQLVIAGPGLNTAYGAEVKALAAEDPDIIFTDMLKGRLKWGAFYGCEAFVLPSHQENFGIAVVEALACGKPVLISDQVNIWREIENQGGGLVNKDSLEGAEQLLLQWCNLDREQKHLIGQEALATYQKHFTVEEAAKKMAEALKLKNECDA